MPSIITGKKILTVALMDDHGVCDHPSPAMTAVGDGGDYLINGSRLLVPYADAADEIIVCAMLTGRIGGPTLFKVDRRSQGVCCMPLETVYGEKKYAVEFVNVKVRSGDVIGTVGEGHLCMGRILPKAIVIKCAEMVGGLQHVVDATVAYAKSRIQFGHPIGSLQSVQHLCADMMSLYLGAKLTAYQAASLLNENMPCDKEVAVAKARCSDAYKTCTWMAHQIHGGIGFTEEYHLQLYFKHAKETELIFGDSRYHRSRVAATMGL